MAEPTKSRPLSAERRADEVLCAVFDVVVAKAREDRAFADRLIAALGRETALARPKRASAPVTTPLDLAALDIAALVAADGRAGARRRLQEGGWTVAQLRARATQDGLSLKGVGRRKSDVVAALVSAHAPSRAAAFG